MRAGAILSAREVAPTWHVTVDAVVVGVGAAGREALAELSSRGLRVVGVDGGPGPGGVVQLPVRLPLWTCEGSVRLPEGATADEAVLAAGRGTSLARRAEQLGRRVELLEQVRRSVLAAHGAAEATELSPLERALEEAARATGGKARRYMLAAPGVQPGSPALERALAAGASVMTGARVEALRVRRRRVVGVEGSLIDHARMAEVGTFRVDARAVLLCASSIEALGLVQASGLKGRGLTDRVELDVTAFLPMEGGPSHERNGWRTSPVEAVGFRRLLVDEKDHGRSVRVGVARLRPSELAMVVPGFGSDHARQLEPYGGGAALAVTWTGLVGAQVRARSVDRVVARRVEAIDAPRLLAFGLQEGTRLAHELGASGVLVPLSPPRRLSSSADPERAVESGEVSAHVPQLWARTARGGLVAGTEERCTPVDAEGVVRDVDGLRVAGIAALGPEVTAPPLLEVLSDGARVGALLADALR